MFDLGHEIQEILNAFAPLFSKPVWLNAQIMIIVADPLYQKENCHIRTKSYGIGSPRRGNDSPTSIES